MGTGEGGQSIKALPFDLGNRAKKTGTGYRYAVAFFNPQVSRLGPTSTAPGLPLRRVLHMTGTWLAASLAQSPLGLTGRFGGYTLP